MCSTPVLIPSKLWNKTALLKMGLIASQPLVQVETNEELIELWLANKKSRHTRRAYQLDIDYFLGFIENKPLPLVTGNDLIAYKQALENSLNQKKAGETISPNTVTRRLLGVRSLFAFACDKAGLLPFNVSKVLEPPKFRDRRSERILTESQVLMMIGMEPSKEKKLLIRFLYDTGCRISELTGLRWKHLIELESGCGLAVLLGKGDKVRNVIIPAQTWTELMMMGNIASPNDPVFEGRGKRAISQTEIRRIIQAAAERAGINKNVSPHWLRHSHATHAANRNVPLPLIQSTLGHTNVATTSTYLHARPNDSSSLYLPR